LTQEVQAEQDQERLIIEDQLNTLKSAYVIILLQELNHSGVIRALKMIGLLKFMWFRIEMEQLLAVDVRNANVDDSSIKQKYLKTL